MQTAAWKNGLDGSALPGMTPTEVAGLFEACKAQRRLDAACTDRSAWLIGSYCGVGVNAPKKYPRKPRNADKILRQGEPVKVMTDDEMKAVALDFAARWNNGIKLRDTQHPV